MKKRSWILLALSIVLIGFLILGYLGSRPGPTALTEADATAMLQQMTDALAQKDTRPFMEMLTPDPNAKIDGLTPEQIRAKLQLAFHQEGKINVTTSHLAFQSGDEPALDFDYDVKTEMGVEPPAGHATLHFRRIDTPLIFGLFQKKQWRVVGVDAPGIPTGE